MKKLIKNKFKILVCLSIIYSLVFTTSVLGQEQEIKEKNSDKIKFSNNISEEEINKLSENMIREIKEENGTLVSISDIYIDFNEGKVTRSVMPTSDFRLSVSASRIDEKKDKDNFLFIATGYWIKNPTFEFTDCIGLTWSDEFTLYSDDGYTVSNGYKDYSAAKLNKAVPESGLAYDIDLRLLERQEEIILKAKVYKDDDTGSANVVAEYGHVIITPSTIDVSISSGKEIGMGVGITSSIEKASPDYTYFDY